MSNTERTLRARIEAVDNFTRPMRRVIAQTRAFQSVANRIRPVVVRVQDMASRVLDRISRGLHNIRSIRQVQTILRVVDQATNVIKKVTSGLVKFGTMVAKATVTVADKASGVLDSIKGKLAAIAAASITIGAKVGIQSLGEEQTQKITINRVIENSGKSKEQAKKQTEEYYKYLEDYANKTPFSTSSVAQFGTKAMMMSKGNTDQAKMLTDQMGNVKAFVGDLRTEQEVAEAFFSAGNGNMEMLNNMLGTQYKTFEEAQKGIAKNQSGLVDLMSQTLPGLISTIGGNITNMLKGIVKQFEGPLKSSFIGIIGFMESVSPKIETFFGRVANIDLGGLFASFDFSTVTSALQPVTDLLDKMFRGIETKSPVTMGIMQVLGTIFNVVFQGIGAIISAVAPTIESIFKFIGQHSEEISTIIQALGSIWSIAWDTMGVLLGIAWAIIKPLLESLIGFLSTTGQWIKDIGKWWTNMCDTIKNNPITAKINQVWEGVTGDKTKPKKSSKKNPKKAFGSNRIIGNDINYRLHDGEKILTRQEADSYDKGNNGQGVVVNVHGMTIREDADIRRVAKEFMKEFKKQQAAFGGAY